MSLDNQFDGGSAGAPGRMTPKCRVIILIPVFQDWASVSAVCRELDTLLSSHPELAVRVLLVDDGSPEGTAGWQPFPCEALTDVLVLSLRSNLGHQRAICVGLCHIQETLKADLVLVMDADGEDRPEDAVRLIQVALAQTNPVLFAERRRRFAGTIFSAGYAAFRIVHRILTGVSVRVGNFSVLRFSTLARLVAMPELWNHYAGAVFRSRLRFDTVPMDRGTRLEGQPKMNLVSLVTHGLAGIASFQETVATRILIFNALGLLPLLAAVAVVAGIRMFTNLAIPGWATYTTGFIVISSLQLLALSFNLVFTLVSNRTRAFFLPMRDCQAYVEKVAVLLSPAITRAAAGSGD